MSENFDRLFDLAKKSSSRLIVYDPQGGQHLAILGIDDFEQLLGSGPPKPAATKELPVPAAAESLVNDDEPLYYEEIPQEEEVEPVTPPSSPEPEEKAEAEVESKPAPELELEFESEAEKEPEVETEAETPQQFESVVGNTQELPVDDSNTAPIIALPSSRDWHRLGDVLRQVHPEIGQAVGKTPVPYQEHSDEHGESEGTNEPESPVFLEEPLE